MRRSATLLRLALAFGLALAAPVAPRPAGAEAGGFALVLCSGAIAWIGPGGEASPTSEGEHGPDEHCPACMIAKALPETTTPVLAADRAATPGPAAARASAPRRVARAMARGPPARA